MEVLSFNDINTIALVASVNSLFILSVAYYISYQYNKDTKNNPNT